MIGWLQPAHVASASIASAVTIVAQSAVTSGVDETTGWAAGVIVAGVAVFRFMDRRQREADKVIDTLRRRDDEEAQERIRVLESQVAAERASQDVLRAQHAEQIRQLTERLISVLAHHQTPVTDG